MRPFFVTPAQELEVGFYKTSHDASIFLSPEVLNFTKVFLNACNNIFSLSPECLSSILLPEDYFSNTGSSLHGS